MHTTTLRIPPPPTFDGLRLRQATARQVRTAARLGKTALWWRLVQGHAPVIVTR